jgi:hypothetical protein
MTPQRKKLVKRLAKRDGGMKCFLCGVALTYETVTVDHWLPKDAGGTNEDRNLRLACQPCNNAKSDIVPLKDGSIPRKVRKAYTVRVPRPLICEKCDAGRALVEGQLCPECGTGPQPYTRPRYLKLSVQECDHELFWCSACCLWMASEAVS